MKNNNSNNNTAITNGSAVKAVANGTTAVKNGVSNGHTPAPPSGGGGKANLYNGSSTTNGHNHSPTITNGIGNVEDKIVEEATGKADIQIQGNLLKIARTGPVDWSDDEYEEEEEEKKERPQAPAPPPPPPPKPAPPPPPPMPSG